MSGFRQSYRADLARLLSRRDMVTWDGQREAFLRRPMSPVSKPSHLSQPSKLAVQARCTQPSLGEHQGGYERKELILKESKMCTPWWW